jgi:hypothetical protein
MSVKLLTPSLKPFLTSPESDIVAESDFVAISDLFGVLRSVVALLIGAGSVGGHGVLNSVGAELSGSERGLIGFGEDLVGARGLGGAAFPLGSLNCLE